MNSVQISGNVSRDPNLRFTKNGTAVCRFSVACNDDYIDSNGEKKERTNYPSVTVWGKLAETCGDKIMKGSRVFVSGRLTTGSYEKNGQKHYTTDITADFVSLNITNKESGQTATTGQEASSFDSMGTPMQEEIPF